MSAPITIAPHRVTVRGPDVVAMVSWADVCAYLRAYGWIETSAGIYRSSSGRFIDPRGDDHDIRWVIGNIARLADVAEHEMLMRIAGLHDRAELRARLVAELRAAGDEAGALACRSVVDVKANAHDIVGRSRRLLSAQLLADLGIEAEVDRG